MDEATREVVSTFSKGDVVEGKYRIERLLDEGGMGSIYHAIQEPLGRDVALKVLKPKDETLEKREHRYKRFFREASLSSKLAHPNTIVVLDYGELSSADQDGFYFVMEYLEGKSLRQLLLDRGSLGVKLTIHIAMQIASSLADAHRQGVIHRDLKPPNIMLVPRGDDPYFVKVLDFGLVKQLEPEEGAEELTSENALIGSPMYMAPERFLHVKSDSPAVDVYALGIMMYEMLVGRPPFIRDTDSTLHQIMLQHIQVTPPPMRSLRPDLVLPPGLETIIMQCLEKEPGDRVGSMDRLLQLLRACGAEAGMQIATPVEDTGTFPELLYRPHDDSQDRLQLENTGETEVHTVEEPARSLVDTSPTKTHATDPAPAPRATKATMVLVLATLLLIAAVAVVVASTAGGPKSEAPTAPPSPAPTIIAATTEPSGATATIDGGPLGTTPFETPVELEEATTLTFQKPGFQPFHYRVTPAPDQRVDIAVTLEPDVATPKEEPVRDAPEARAADPTDASDGSASPRKAEESREPTAETKRKPARKQPNPAKPARDLDIKLDR